MSSRLAYAGRGALNLLATLIVLVAAQMLVHGRVPGTLGPIVVSLVFLASYLAGVRWIERGRPAELTRAGFAQFSAGLGLGFGIFTAVMLLLWILGAYHPSGWGGIAPLGAGLASALPAAVVEEILFRGFLFRLSAKLMGLWGALALTSALFGAAHAFNPGATAGSSLAIALEAGVLLGAAYALTGNLWLPIGLHLAWNFTEGSVFGMSVSGGAARNSLIAGTLRGPALLTGGAFGPEASIIAVLVCLALSAVLLSMVLRRSRPQAGRQAV
jgi:membrane protease YdiL (CAAX protease family)